MEPGDSILCLQQMCYIWVIDQINAQILVL